MDRNNRFVMERNLKEGYNSYTKEGDKTGMLLDTGILVLKKGQTFKVKKSNQEKAVLIWSGKAEVKLENDKKIILVRKDFWKDFLMALHGDKDESFTILALEDSEFVIEAIENVKNFETKLYDKSNCKVGISGQNYSPSTSIRYVIDVFNINNAPYSNMVLGEVFATPGHWSGYPPHNHDQPETYIYRFNKEHGFGLGLIDDDAFVVKNNGALFIPSKGQHQNASAPGYQMYFTWMIPNLKNNPWNKRSYDERHKWINEPNLKIKASKEIGDGKK